jgi:hypothetical protein
MDDPAIYRMVGFIFIKWYANNIKQPNKRETDAMQQSKKISSDFSGLLALQLLTGKSSWVLTIITLFQATTHRTTKPTPTTT